MLHSKHRIVVTSVRAGERAVGAGAGGPVQICFLAAVRPQDAAKGLKLGFLTCKVGSQL